MASGIEIKGNVSNVQITSESFSYMLENNFQISNSTIITTAGIVALNPQSGSSLSAPVRMSSNKNEFTIKGIGRAHVFGNNVSRTNFGIEVYREDGTVAYNSGSKLLKVIDSGVLDAEKEFRKNYGRSVAVVFNSSVARAVPTSQSGGAWGARLVVSNVKKESDGSIVIGENPNFTNFLIPRPEPITYSDKAHFLIIDASEL